MPTDSSLGKAPVGVGYGDCAGESAGVREHGMPRKGWMSELGKPMGFSTRVSSGSKALMTSDHNDPAGGGSARTTKEAGQRPQRKGAEQDSLFDEGYTAAPEVELTVVTKLAELTARALHKRSKHSPTLFSLWMRSYCAW